MAKAKQKASAKPHAAARQPVASEPTKGPDSLTLTTLREELLPRFRAIDDPLPFLLIRMRESFCRNPDEVHAQLVGAYNHLKRFAYRWCATRLTVFGETRKRILLRRIDDPQGDRGDPGESERRWREAPEAKEDEVVAIYAPDLRAPALAKWTALATTAGNLLGSWAVPFGVAPETIVCFEGAVRWLHAVLDLAWAGKIIANASRTYFDLKAEGEATENKAGARRLGLPFLTPGLSAADLQELEAKGNWQELADAAMASGFAVQYLTAAGPPAAAADRAGERASEGGGKPRRQKPTDRKPTKRETTRVQRIKFTQRFRGKHKGATWQEVYEAYREKYPDDKTARADTLRLTWGRNPDQA